MSFPIKSPINNQPKNIEQKINKNVKKINKAPINVKMCHIPHYIGFNNKYMLDALKNTDTDEVKLVLNGPVSPIIIKPVSGDSFLSIVVPMRLANEN